MYRSIPTDEYWEIVSAGETGMWKIQTTIPRQWRRRPTKSLLHLKAVKTMLLGLNVKDFQFRRVSAVQKLGLIRRTLIDLSVYKQAVR